MADTAGWRWIPHPEHAWVAGRKKLEDPVTKVQTWTSLDNEDIEYKAGEIDESKLEAVSETSLGKDLDNLVQLDEFGEGAIVHQLRKRYKIDKIYTTIGTILVSVNPYKLLPIYTSSVVDKYREDYTNMAPHVFQIAADAYKRLLDEGTNQAVIISGESGAGKTEATKTVLQYLSDVAGSTSNVEQQILQSNPCLEAFGNAKTLRNDNSSRFGKWMEVAFAIGGRICAARIINYLLEKSRVVKQAEGERNYHIFYQVTRGLPQATRDKIFIAADPKEYLYLKQSGCFSITGVDEAHELGRTMKAMRDLNFTDTEMNEIWVVLSSILNIGNLQIAADKSKDGTVISNNDQLEKVAKILQLNSATLQTAVTFRSVTIRGSVSMIPLKLDEAIDNRDALAKALYGKMFDWIIRKINQTLMKVDLAENNLLTIGILDIFGFEIFENNAFEQFCINYANEKLQQHFNEHIFKLEQEEYKKEKIDVSFIEFVDNIECLKLIEATPLGILKMLDEEVTIPKGGDKSLITKMHKKFAEEDKHPFYGLIRRQPEVFIIKHYAGAVVYDSTGFVNKNRDKLHDSLTDLVQQSEVALVREIFKGEDSGEEAKGDKAEKGATMRRGAARAARKPAAAGTQKAAAKGGSRTLCAQFYAQLQQLMKTLTAANPHYIRCIKPNTLKVPGTFSSKMVLRQMQYAGLFEAIRIRKAGFPFRVPHNEFVQRYRVCLKKDNLKHLVDLKGDDSKGAAWILSCFSEYLDKKEYQMGVSKIFMRNSQRLILTRLRDAALTVCVLKIQAYRRGVNSRRKFKKLQIFAEKVKRGIEGRVIGELKLLLQEAGEANMEIFLLRRVDELITYLEEEKRVASILEEGCKENELEPINAGLEQVEVLAKKFPAEPQADFFKKIIAQAESQKHALIRKDKARKLLKEAQGREDIKELQEAIKEAKEAGLGDEEWAEAQKLLERLEAEEKCIQDLLAAVEAVDLVQIEARLPAAENVPLDAKRKEVIANAKSALKKGYYETLKARMIAAKDDLKNHLPTYECVTPVEELPLPPEEKYLHEELIPKLEALKYLDLAANGKIFLAEQVNQRRQALKESHFSFLQQKLQEAQADAKNHAPTYLVDSLELPLPPVEKAIRDDILPKLEKLQYNEYVEEAKIVLQRLAETRVQELKNAHHDFLEATLKKAEEDAKNYVPDHMVDTPVASLPLPPEEAKIKSEILPRLTKLGYQEFIVTAETFLETRLAARETALKSAHRDYLQTAIKAAEADSASYLPTPEKPKVASELPPNEQKIKDEIIPKLTKLGFTDLLENANLFLETEQAKREARSLQILQDLEEAERKRIREEERKKHEEEEKRKLDEQRAEEEKRLAVQRAALADVEKKRLEEEDRKRKEEEDRKLKERLEAERREEEAKAKQEAEEREARRAEAEKKLREAEEKRLQAEANFAKEKEQESSEQRALEAKLAETKKKQEEDFRREKEERERKAKELQEQERLAAAKAEQASKKRGPPAPPRSVAGGGLPPPPPEDDFAAPPPPPPEEMELPPPPPPEDDGAEKREEELNKAIKARSLSLITTLLAQADAHQDKTRTVRIARNLKDVLTEERKILTQLKQCLDELNVNPLKSLLREAANLGLDNSIISEARHLCYGMSKSELLTKRITLALKNREAKKLAVLLDEAKEDGIENEEVEHARDFVASELELEDWNSKMRLMRGKTVSGVTPSMQAAYQAFLDSKGVYPLRKFPNLRKEGNYAKKNYFRKKGLKKKRLVWQKEDVPRSLVKLSTAHCGGVKKSRLVKKIAIQIFKNIRGYMGDHYHAYPVTLAYEVVNTGVNEELLRDEIFCQLIKQTTKNPSLDSSLLGWKLLYLCVSTFWPSLELKPYLTSHLAAHAPPKIDKREFGFNSIPDLAYHCYIALDDKSPPAGEPPSMQDIEKITNGTLGSVKSFFSMDNEGDEKGAPVTETGDVQIDGDPSQYPETYTTDGSSQITSLFKAAPPPPPPPTGFIPPPPAPADAMPPDGPPPPDAPYTGFTDAIPPPRPSAQFRPPV